MALTRRPFAARLFLVVSATVLGALGCAACSSAGAPPATEPNPTAALVPAENRAVSFAESAVAVHLPTTRGRPAPTLASGAFERPLRPHQVVGFLPYWEVGAFTPGFSGLTTLAYWSVSLAAGGSIDDKGQGYSTLSSADLGLDVLRAHEAGVRVLLSVFSESNSVIASVSAHPSPAGRRLAAKMATLLRAGGFDGVDLDIEGDSTPDRKGFVQFVAAFAKSLRSMDRRWSVVIDTYPSSAYDPEGFFDIRALAPYVDQFFVMAYDMQEPDIASATAPLTDAYLNDALTLAEYTSVVPATKIVLGIPLYGIDFPTTSRQDGAETTGTQVSVTYQQIVAAGRAALWDPVTETPYTVFRRQGHWHQTWFDDPVSIALKTALAIRFGCAGVGVWELGMAGGDPSISAALLGGSPALKLPLAGSVGAITPR